MSKKKLKERGVFKKRVACPFKECGSSDAGALYEHEDGSWSYKCFSAKCGRSIYSCEPNTFEVVEEVNNKTKNWEEEMEKLEEIRDNLTALSVKDRRVTADIYDLYGVKMELNEAGDRLEAIYYPTYRAGEHVGYRPRMRYKEGDKRVLKKPELLGVLKKFGKSVGDCYKGIDLFGQWVFPAGGKRIILTCGEEDAIAVAAMTKEKDKYGKPWPAVSTPSGEDISWVQPHLEYLTSFEEIFIIPDADEQGKAFEKELCRVLPVGKVKIIRLPKKYKDPSDLRQDSNSKQRDAVNAEIFWKLLWNAQSYSPVGIKVLSQVWETYKDIGDEVLIPLPECFGALQDKTNGLELGAIHGIAASTSVGKTAFIGEILYNARIETPYNIGICSAEDTCEEYLRTLISVHIKKPLKEYLKSQRDLDEENEARKWLEGPTGNRFSLIDNAGTADLAELLQKVEWLITAQDCKVIALDPVTLLVGSENTSLDDFMSDILKLAKRHMVAFLLVFHTRKTGQGQAAASQGAEITIEDIKSSGSAGQVCASIMLLNRNKEHENEIVKNTTTARWGKFRRKGSATGTREYIFYNAKTGRLELGVNPEITLENSSDPDKEDWGD